jgi:hypothetical protein
MLARAVIPVYHRRPKNEQAGQKDRREVDQFAQDASSAPNAGNVRSELSVGGSIAGVKEPELIILTGHGNVQSMNSYSGVELADKLKTTWGLKPEFAGELRILSCKAGSPGEGFFGINASSLVDDVSNALQGYKVTVSGLKGNVIIPLKASAVPGLPRSLTSDTALATYNDLEKSYRELERQCNAEFMDSPGGAAQMNAGGARAAIGPLEFKLRMVPRDTGGVVEGLLNAVMRTKTAFEVIQEQIEAEKQSAAKNQAIADAERLRIDRKWAPKLKKVLDEMNEMGTPFGHSQVTVRVGPDHRKGFMEKVNAVLFSDEDEKSGKQPAEKTS